MILDPSFLLYLINYQQTGKTVNCLKTLCFFFLVFFLPYYLWPLFSYYHMGLSDI